MNKFKNKLHYTWLYYVVALLLSIALWIVSFNLFHAPKEFESINIFFAGTVSDYDIKDEIQTKFSSDGVKSVEVFSSSPADSTYSTKYNVVGLNGSDICIVPLSVAEKTQCNLTFMEFTETFSCETFSQEGTIYGIILPESAKANLQKYFSFTSEDYVLLINEASVNSGSESSLNDNAQKIVEWLVNYV